jgi:hypothetical protein
MVKISLTEKEPQDIDTTPEKRKLITQEKLKNKKKKREIEECLCPELEEWDPRQLPQGFFLVLEGKRRTGKSTFAKWLLQWYQDRFSLVWVMSQTAASGYWQEFVGSKFVFSGYDSNGIKKLIERNDKIIEKWGEESKEALVTGSALIILDDCISPQIFQDPWFIKLAVEGRHHLLNVIFVTQDPKTICPKVRDNADVAVIFNQKTFRNKESIWHDFMNDVGKDEALALLAKNCEEHNALVCVQTNLNGDIKKNFFKSTGNKTILQDPHYILGGPTQKRLILEERKIAKAQKRIREIERKGDKRPVKDKVDEDLKAEVFTVENILSDKSEWWQK